MLVSRNSNWLPEIFNTLLDNAFVPTSTTGTGKPAINVIERENDYAVELAAPGMTREDFTVRLDEESNLVVELEKKAEKTDESAHYLRHEFSMTKFHQTLLLPDDVDREGIEAKAEHGVLTVTLPKIKAPEKKECKQIEIK